jgi:glycosyltransferase involved in cell wall biosynthesis
MTYGREITGRNIKWINKIPNKNIVFTGSTKDLISRGGVAGRWEAVFNAIDFSKYTLQPQYHNDAPLIFLGRLERTKGCRVAIEVAKATNSRLIIAGNTSKLPDQIAYFKNEIEPLIDGEQIVYVGQVDDAGKNHYLGGAKALLFPINASEAFGMVMAEAMACGTPVIGFDIFSVNEVIEEGVTGFKVGTTEEMKAALKRLPEINRTKCREYAQEKFDVPIVAENYLSLFNSTLSH